MDKYVYIKSDQSDKLFVTNEPYCFRVQLKLPLYLTGSWKVGLVEFHATEKSDERSNADEGLYIYSEICEESIVYGESRPLLRRIEKSSKGRFDYRFENPIYVPVMKTELREFEVCIKRENKEDATELRKPVYLTLHLKPCHFKND